MSQQERATILLIDDHPMLRTGVKQLISMAPDIQVIGEASNGAQGIELAESLDPDLILLDLNMPGMNGLETLDKLREKSLSGRVVVFSVSNHEEDVVTALKHASATEVTVTVSQRDNQVRLVVADNGRGVPDHAERSNHYGLIIMRDRAQSLRGDCQVRRRETGGTEVIVTFIPEKTFSIQ